MNFYSTNNRAHKVNLREAVISGLAPDNGLYMPEHITPLPKEFFENIESMTFRSMALRIAMQLVDGEVPESDLEKIINDTITFDAPIVEIEKDLYALELFHGPTLAFKDFGARFMSRLLAYYASKLQKEIVILVATSGDTGSAVANGFLNTPNTRVIILYPSDKVSDLQERQFTTLGKNINAIKIDGTFDDCQRLVKKAFLDRDLRKKYFLTSANSINIARLIPQTFYYIYAWSQLPKKTKCVFSVPSGNFGNLTAGLIAKRLGLPIAHFIAATNINDIVPLYLKTADFNPRPSQATISNAMDVGNPSNFSRMLAMYNNDHAAMNKEVTGYSFSDEETRNVIKKIYEQKGYMLDPHGAIGYLGLRKYLVENKESVGVFLETAHPAKFKTVVEDILGEAIPLPDTLASLLDLEKKMTDCTSDYSQFRKVLTSILN